MYTAVTGYVLGKDTVETVDYSLVYIDTQLAVETLLLEQSYEGGALCRVHSGEQREHHQGTKDSPVLERSEQELGLEVPERSGGRAECDCATETQCPSNLLPENAFLDMLFVPSQSLAVGGLVGHGNLP